MKRHTSGASSISLKQQKKQNLIRKKRKLAAAKRWENIHNLASLHQHRAKIALDTERIARGGGQYAEDLPSSSTILPSVSNEWPFSHVTHDMGAQIELSKQLTTFYPHSSTPVPDRNPSPSPRQTQIEFTPSSTLAAAHVLANSCPDLVTPSSRFGPSTTKIGLLCSVSHKSKGGKLQGFDDHTDALLRSTSLVTNLLDSQAARSFYEQHKETWKQSEGSGVHNNSMLYAPGVAAFRKDDMEEEVVKGEGADVEDDEFELIISSEPDANLVDNRSPSPRMKERQGTFISPYVINVLSAVPVSASVVRKKRFTLPRERPIVDTEIRSLMRERMTRCLRVFEQRGERAIVLGAFGCGCSSQNSVDMVASLWAELVACEGARFKDVFERIVFAVSGKQYAPFKSAFEMRLFEEQVDLALSFSDVDTE